MKSTLLLVSTLLTAFTLTTTLPTTYAQDYTQWGLPEGAKARLGKGEVYAMQFSQIALNFRWRVVLGFGVTMYKWVKKSP